MVAAKIALSVIASFSSSYLFGFLQALPSKISFFLTALIIGSILSLPLVLVGMAWVVGLVGLRYAANEVIHSEDTFSILRRQPVAIAMIALFGSVAVDRYYTSGEMFYNFGYAALLFLVFFFQYCLYVASSSSKDLRLRMRYFLVNLQRRPKRTFGILLSFLLKFLSYNSIFLIFVVGAWFGYSRGEYLSKNFSVELINMGEGKVAPIFETSNGIVFLNKEGDLIYLSEPNFKMSRISHD